MRYERYRYWEQCSRKGDVEQRASQTGGRLFSGAIRAVLRGGRLPELSPESSCSRRTSEFGTVHERANGYLGGVDTAGRRAVRRDFGRMARAMLECNFINRKSQKHAVLKGKKTTL
jgi:hypothetical protein